MAGVESRDFASAGRDADAGQDAVDVVLVWPRGAQRAKIASISRTARARPRLQRARRRALPQALPVFDPPPRSAPRDPRATAPAPPPGSGGSGPAARVGSGRRAPGPTPSPSSRRGAQQLRRRSSRRVTSALSRSERPSPGNRARPRRASVEELEKIGDQAQPRRPDPLSTKAPWREGASDSGGGIRTCDLRVMSPTSYLAAPPRGVFHILPRVPGLSTPFDELPQPLGVAGREDLPVVVEVGEDLGRLAPARGPAPPTRAARVSE